MKGSLLGTWLWNLQVGGLLCLLLSPLFFHGWESFGASFWPTFLAILVFPAVIASPLILFSKKLIRQSLKLFKIVYWSFTVAISLVFCSVFSYDFDEILTFIVIYVLVGNVVFYRIMDIKLWNLKQ